MKSKGAKLEISSRIYNAHLVEKKKEIETIFNRTIFKMLKRTAMVQEISKF